jgi:hypothetical protein
METADLANTLLQRSEVEDMLGGSSAPAGGFSALGDEE